VQWFYRGDLWVVMAGSQLDRKAARNRQQQKRRSAATRATRAPRRGGECERGGAQVLGFGTGGVMGGAEARQGAGLRQGCTGVGVEAARWVGQKGAEETVERVGARDMGVMNESRAERRGDGMSSAGAGESEGEGGAQ